MLRSVQSLRPIFEALSNILHLTYPPRVFIQIQTWREERPCAPKEATIGLCDNLLQCQISDDPQNHMDDEFMANS